MTGQVEWQRNDVFLRRGCGENRLMKIAPNRSVDELDEIELRLLRLTVGGQTHEQALLVQRRQDLLDVDAGVVRDIPKFLPTRTLRSQPLEM